MNNKQLVIRHHLISCHADFVKISQIYKLHISQKYDFQVLIFLNKTTWLKIKILSKCFINVD